jgi:6-phosphogluconolactonase (cycloisomerase 2 family)
LAVLGSGSVAFGADVYVTGAGSADVVSQYSAGVGGVLGALTPATIVEPEPELGRAIVVSPDGKSVYTADPANRGVTEVSQYSVGSDGTLSPDSPPTVATGDSAGGLAESPNGATLYVTNNPDDTPLPQYSSVSQYSVGTGGALSLVSTFATGLYPDAVAVSPNGASVYVADQGDGTVSQFTVGAGGGLTPDAPATVSAGSGPRSIVVSPSGKSVYVLDYGTQPGSGSIAQFTVGAGGELSADSPASVPLALGASAFAISPNGTTLYVATTDYPSQVIYEYSVGTGGLLTLVGDPAFPVGGGDSVEGIVVSADGTSVYTVDNGGNVYQFSVGGGGLLTADSPPTATSSMTDATGVAVSPLPASVALSVQASLPVILGGSVSASATLSGALGPSGVVTFDVYGPGDSGCVSSLASSTAVVSGNGTYSSASFTPSVPGTYVWTASYGGDGVNAAQGPTSCSAPAAAVSVAGGPPVVVTGAASGVSGSVASLSGSVNPTGSQTSYVFEYGTSTSFGSISAPQGVGSNDSPVAAVAGLSGLATNTTYFYRLVASNSIGTTAGAVSSFSTGSGGPPLVTTGAASAVANTTATLAAHVNPDGQATAFTFEYGTSTSFGQISPPVELDNAFAAEPVSASLTGLQADTTYDYRVVASNAAGTTVGSVVSFNTGPGGAPLVTTGAASAITATGATLAGSVNPEGSQTAFTFAYGTTPQNLNEITAVDNAGSTDGPQSITLPVTGLTPGTTYTYRLIASNANGTATGTARTFTTPSN